MTAPRAIVEPTEKFTKAPGAEPIQGIRLLELLGKSALGEVWRGADLEGQPKAEKFVAGP